MKPILIYDGYCNLCISLIKTLEAQNRTETGDLKVNFIPYQKAEHLIKAYNLQSQELKSALHYISSEGIVYKAGEAINRLSNSFFMLKLGSNFFTTELGDKFYKMIASNRYGIFGCADECYISDFYESSQLDN